MLLPWRLSVNDISNGSAENHEPKKKNSVQSLKSYLLRVTLYLIPKRNND